MSDNIILNALKVQWKDGNTYTTSVGNDQRYGECKIACSSIRMNLLTAYHSPPRRLRRLPNSPYSSRTRQNHPQQDHRTTSDIMSNPIPQTRQQIRNHTTRPTRPSNQNQRQPAHHPEPKRLPRRDRRHYLGRCIRKQRCNLQPRNTTKPTATCGRLLQIKLQR
jgi:hypothetical protein